MSASSSEGSEYVPYCCSCYHCYRRDRFSYTATKRIDENVPLRAVKENDVEALQKWLDEHPRVKLSNWGNSVLSEAVHRNRVKCVKALLRHGGVDVNEWFYKESDPSWWCNGVSDSQLVHKAARLKNERILKMLINHGAFLDASTIHRPELNLYYIAASNRNEKVMELIIDADVCDISNDRRRLYDYDSASFNPLWCAMKKKNKAVVDLLVEAGASVEKDVLCDAVAHDDNPKWLRRLHAIDDARFLEFSGEMCRTAVWNNNLVNLDFLLEKGANFDEPDDDGSSACAIAARSGNSAIVERLLRAGAKVPSCALGSQLKNFRPSRRCGRRHGRRFPVALCCQQQPSSSRDGFP
jgi:ankyrin repeat protein